MDPSALFPPADSHRAPTRPYRQRTSQPPLSDSVVHYCTLRTTTLLLRSILEFVPVSLPRRTTDLISAVPFPACLCSSTMQGISLTFHTALIRGEYRLRRCARCLVGFSSVSGWNRVCGGWGGFIRTLHGLHVPPGNVPLAKRWCVCGTHVL